MKYFKDKNGQIYDVSPIQTPQDDWIQLKPEEIEAHLKPSEPTNEEKAEQLKRDIIELEMKQLRSLKAIMRDGTEEDEKIYNEIEAEIQAKREEIRGLENGN